MANQPPHQDFVVMARNQDLALRDAQVGLNPAQIQLLTDRYIPLGL